MNNLILIYLLISFISLFFLTKVSYILKLVDLPNSRKIHSKPTAYTGGIILSIILICSIELFSNSKQDLNMILSIGFLISCVGFIDDKYNLNIGGKLSLQIIPVIYLIIFQDLYLDNIGDYDFFKLDLGTFAIPFTLLSILLLINATNYFDGIDGLLGTTFITVLCILYFLVSDYSFRLFLIIIIIPVNFFLFFNFSFFKLPKLFLGDGGSLLLGFILSFSLIYLEKKNFVHPILLAWSVAIFVFEFLSINIIRIKNNKKLFKAGNDHLHHLIFKSTKSIFLTNLYLNLIHIILFTIGYLSFVMFNPLVSLILFMLLFIIFFTLRNIYSKK